MKKLTYLVASLVIAVAAGATFTGCINSDEPAGIESLREAKAALIKSKQALIEAQAAKELAEAEAIKVEAAAKAALAEAEKARIEAESEEIKQRAAIAMLEAQTRIEEAQAKIEKLKQELEEAKLTYEQEKLELSEQQIKSVEYYYQNYFLALEEYNEKYTAWLKAQKDLVANALDDERGTKFDEKERVEDAVAEAEKNLADANKEIADLTDSIAVVKTWKPTELGAKLTQYEKEVEANNEQLGLINLKIAENENESEEAKRYRELQAEVNDLKNEEITIPAYTFNADGNINIPGVETEELFEEGRYSLNELDYNTYYNYYDVVCRALEGKKAWLSDYVLNENGQAWTQAEINELTRNKADNDKTYEENLAKWQMFVKAYNQGAEPDYKALEGYDAINEAVTAFNKSIAPLEAAKAELIKAEEAKLEASKALNSEAADKAEEDKNAAYTAANKAFETAQKAAYETYDATMAKLNESAQKAYLDLQVGLAKQNEANMRLAAKPDDKDLIKAAEDAAKAVDGLQKDLAAAEKAIEEQEPKAKAEEDKAIAVADAVRQVAYAEADKAYELAMTEAIKDNSALGDAFEAAVDKFEEAQAAYNDELDKVKEGTLKEVWAAVEKQIETIGGYSYRSNLYNEKFDNATNYSPIADPENADEVEARKAFEAKIPECIVAEICAYRSEDLRLNVIGASYTLYGNVVITRLPENNSTEAFLVPLTKDEVIDYITSNNINQDELWYNYGSYGSVLAYENRIEVAQAYLSNQAAVDAAFAELDKTIEDLKATKDAQEEKVKKAEEEREKAWQAVQDLNEELYDQRNELYNKNHIANTMISAIRDAALLTGADQEDNYTQESIDLVIENVEKAIEELESGIPALEKAVERAKYMLDQYEKGQLSEADMAQLDVEKAKLALDLAKAKLDAAKAQLDAANKRLEEAA